MCNEKQQCDSPVPNPHPYPVPTPTPIPVPSSDCEGCLKRVHDVEIQQKSFIEMMTSIEGEVKGVRSDVARLEGKLGDDVKSTRAYSETTRQFTFIIDSVRSGIPINLAELTLYHGNTAIDYSQTNVHILPRELGVHGSNRCVDNRWESENFCHSDARDGDIPILFFNVYLNRNQSFDNFQVRNRIANADRIVGARIRLYEGPILQWTGRFTDPNRMSTVLI
jgi:hypothetical protein